MENGKPPLEPALRALAARAEGQLGEHPSPETLIAYHEGRLAGEERERLRDHLALCTDCAQLLLDLAALPELEVPAGLRGPSDGEVGEAWLAMQARLKTEEKPGAPALPIPPNVVPLSRPVPQPRPAYATWALAASWLLVAGLGLWVFELRRENARLAAPDGKVTVAGLREVGDTTRGGDESREPRPLHAARRLVLHLAASGLDSHAAYEADIREDGKAGRTVWSGRTERDPEANDFILDLPPGFLRPGRYRVYLYGSDAGPRQELAQYTFQVGAS